MDFLTIMDYQTATICQTSTTEPEEAETNNNLRKRNPMICILYYLFIVFTQLKVSITKAKTTGTCCSH